MKLILLLLHAWDDKGHGFFQANNFPCDENYFLTIIVCIFFVSLIATDVNLLNLNVFFTIIQTSCCVLFVERF